MHSVRRITSMGLLSLICIFMFPLLAVAQTESSAVHQIEGRVQHRSGGTGRIHIRLLKLPDMRPVTETFTRPEGQFTFSGLNEGSYAIETFETDKFQATMTEVLLRPLIRNRPTSVNVLIELPLRPKDARVAPSEVMADIDMDVPKKAQKHYRAGLRAIENGEYDKGVEELRAAIATHSNFYSARLELGRELRRRKQYIEAEAILRPLTLSAARRPDPHTELGATLLALGRGSEAVKELEISIELREVNWAAHLYLGWALIERDATNAEMHLLRALKIDERAAARAHLALARLAHARGDNARAIRHLDAYVTLAPEAEDTDAARKLADSLRSPK